MVSATTVATTEGRPKTVFDLYGRHFDPHEGSFFVFGRFFKSQPKVAKSEDLFSDFGYLWGLPRPPNGYKIPLGYVGVVTISNSL